MQLIGTSNQFIIIFYFLSLRPHFQEGYLAGTDEITDNYDRKTELDFNNRLIVKFEIPAKGTFWGRGFHQIPESSLYPKSDPIKTLCEEIREIASRELKSGDLGDFLKLWAEIEELVTTHAREGQRRYLSFRQALSDLNKQGRIDKDLYYQLDQIRSFRNRVVHHPSEVDSGMIAKFLFKIEQSLETLVSYPMSCASGESADSWPGTLPNPIRTESQDGNRFRFWGRIEEFGGRVLRVVTLEDKITIHNAFPDRGFKK